MKKPFLFSTIAVAIIASTSAWGAHAGSGAPAVAPASLAAYNHVGLIHAATLPTLLDRGLPALAARLRSQPVASGKGGTTLGWVLGSALNNPAIIDELSRMYAAGVPILLVREPSSSSVDLDARISALFGMASAAPVTVYARAGNGALTVLSLDSGTGSTVPIADLVSRSEQLLTALHTATTRTTRQRRTADTSTAAVDAWAPQIEITSQTIGQRTIRATITVMRHSRPDSDRFKVIAQTSHDLIPFTNGRIPNNNGVGVEVPLRYSIEQSLSISKALTTPQGGKPARMQQPVLVEQFPQATGRTSFAVSDTLKTAASYGVSAKPEITSADPSAIIKSAFSFDHSRQTEKTSSIAYSVDDYSLATHSSRGADRSTVTWHFNLADTISERLRTALRKQQRPEPLLTPAMKQLSPQMIAMWEVDGRATGELRFDVRPSVTNRRFTSRKSSKLELPWHSRHVSSRDVADSRAQSIGTWVLSLDTPYLARQPVALITAQSGDGGCLWDDSGAVRLKPCPAKPDATTPGVVLSHWELDQEGRYVNRGSGRCLAIPSPRRRGDEELVTTACALVNSQRWQWQADRIHSLYDGGDLGWRLYVDEHDIVRAKGAEHLFDLLPVNPSSRFLDPWSTYPRRPVEGATIPVLQGAQPRIPDVWLQLGRVDSSQRWSVTPLRQGLRF